jgi:hypothetical protein
MRSALRHLAIQQERDRTRSSDPDSGQGPRRDSGTTPRARRPTLLSPRQGGERSFGCGTAEIALPHDTERPCTLDSACYRAKPTCLRRWLCWHSSICICEEVWRVKVCTGRADTLPMIISPKYVVRELDRNEPSGNQTSGGLRYERYSDERLNRDLHRQLRRLDEMHLHPASGPGKTALIVRISYEVERIQGELIRRARKRHPSSQGSAN